MRIELYHLSDMSIQEGWPLLRELAAWGFAPVGPVNVGQIVFITKSDVDHALAEQAIREHLCGDLAHVVMRIGDRRS